MSLPDYIQFGILLRIVGYSVLVPGSIMIGSWYYNHKQTWLSILFYAYSVAHAVVLLALVFESFQEISSGALIRLALTPVVIAVAIATTWLAIRIARVGYELEREHKAPDSDV